MMLGLLFKHKYPLTMKNMAKVGFLISICSSLTYCSNDEIDRGEAEQKNNAQTATPVSPDEGSTEGGNEVVIAGFVSYQNQEVWFGDRAAQTLGFDPVHGTMTVEAPRAKGPGYVDIVIRNPSSGSETKLQNAYEYLGPLAPCEGPSGGGTLVTINDLPSGVSAGNGWKMRFADAITGEVTFNAEGTAATVQTPPASPGNVSYAEVFFGRIDPKKKPGPNGENIEEIPLTDNTGSQIHFYYHRKFALHSLSPVSGSTEGRTRVTVFGDNFADDLQVRFDGRLAQTASIASDRKSMVVETPRVKNPGTATVEVFNPANGDKKTIEGVFSFEGPVSPTEGPTTGGTRVTIDGVAENQLVAFGDLNAHVVEYLASNRAVVIAPPSAPGLAPIYAGGAPLTIYESGAAKEMHFRYFQDIAVAGVAPSRGSTEGGTEVTLLGENFTGNTQVTFGGRTGQFVRVALDGTSLVVQTPRPESVGVVDVAVSNPVTGTVRTVPSGFEYYGPIAPCEGPAEGGTEVKIADVSDGQEIRFGDAVCEDVDYYRDGNYAVAVSPPHAGEGLVSVFVAGSPVTVQEGGALLPVQFLYYDGVAVGGISPTSGTSDGGTVVTVSGNRLGDNHTVLFGARTANVVDVDPGGAFIKVEAPAAAATGTVNVTLVDRISKKEISAATYEYEGPISPCEGPITGGTHVTLQTDLPKLNADSPVLFGDKMVDTWTLYKNGAISVVTPPHPEGAVEVSVDGHVLTYDGDPVHFRYLDAAGVEGGPRLVSAVSTSNTSVKVSFNESLQKQSAEDVGNYVITQANVSPESAVLLVKSATLSSDMTSVVLQTASQNEVTYNLAVSNIKDLEGNVLAGPELLVDPTQTQFAGTPPTRYLACDDDAINAGQECKTDEDCPNGRCTWHTEFVDSDGDGLPDNVEQKGWTVIYYKQGGDPVQLTVTSDPFVPDTDGDGLTDAEERAIGTNPRGGDTDGDMINDEHEWNKWFSSPLDQDTDKDGLDDGLEITFTKTSAILEDTDGDGLDDWYEVSAGNRNPLIADMPKPKVEVGSMALYLDTRFSYTDSQGQSRAVNKQTSSTLSSNESRTFTSGGTESTKWAIEYGQKIGVGASAAGVNVSVEAHYNVSAGGEHQSSWSESSVRSTQKAYQESLSTAETEDVVSAVSRQVVGATVQSAVKIGNAGDIAFEISDLELTAMAPDPVNRTDFIPVASLVPSRAADAAYTIGPFDADKGPLVFENRDIYPSLVEDIMRSPRGLIFRMANFKMTDEFGRDFAFLQADVNDRTAGITIDYGNSTVETYNVATFNYFDEDGDHEPEGDFTENGDLRGIRLRDALEDIIGLGRGTSGKKGYQVQKVGVCDGAAPEEAQGKYCRDDSDCAGGTCTEFDVLGRVKDVAALENHRCNWKSQNEGYICENDNDCGCTQGQDCCILNPIDRNGFWTVISSTSRRDEIQWDGESSNGIEFDEIRLHAGDHIMLLYVQDKDGDGLVAREEALYGSSDVPPEGANSDRDDRELVDNEVVNIKGVDPMDDYFEVRTGWEVGVEGQVKYTARPNPTQVDSDGDGLSDIDEMDIVTFIGRENKKRAKDPEKEGKPQIAIKDYVAGKVVRTDPTKADTDGDGISDYDEIVGAKAYDEFGRPAYYVEGGEKYQIVRFTDPLNSDSDGDSLSDGIELRLSYKGANPKDYWDGQRFRDDDQDGLTNEDETNGWKPVFEILVCNDKNGEAVEVDNPENPPEACLVVDDVYIEEKDPNGNVTKFIKNACYDSNGQLVLISEDTECYPRPRYACFEENAGTIDWSIRDSNRIDECDEFRLQCLDSSGLLADLEAKFNVSDVTNATLNVSSCAADSKIWCYDEDGNQSDFTPLEETTQDGAAEDDTIFLTRDELRRKCSPLIQRGCKTENGDFKPITKEDWDNAVFPEGCVTEFSGCQRENTRGVSLVTDNFNPPRACKVFNELYITVACRDQATGELRIPDDPDNLPEECRVTSDPKKPDTDGDGLPDLLEKMIETDPTREDSDGDFLYDYDEFDPESPTSISRNTWMVFNRACDMAAHCGYDFSVSAKLGTSLASVDTDGDSRTDYEEIYISWYVTTCNEEGSNEPVEVFSDPKRADLDNDGLNDQEEFAAGTFPKKADSDEDNILDGSDYSPKGCSKHLKIVPVRYKHGNKNCDYCDGAAIKNPGDFTFEFNLYRDTELQTIKESDETTWEKTDEAKLLKNQPCTFSFDTLIMDIFPGETLEFDGVVNDADDNEDDRWVINARSLTFGEISTRTWPITPEGSDTNNSCYSGSIVEVNIEVQEVKELTE